MVSQYLWSWIRWSDAGDCLYPPSQVKNESKIGSCVYVASITGGKATMLALPNQQKEQLAICPTMSSCLCHSAWGVHEIKPLWRWKREYCANVGMFLVALISVWSFVPNSLVLLDSSCQTSPGQALQTYHSPISTTVAGSELYKITLCFQNPVIVIWSWSTPQSINGEGYNSQILLIIPLARKCLGPCRSFLSRTWSTHSTF